MQYTKEEMEKKLEKVLSYLKKEPAFLRLKGSIIVAGDTHGDVIISKEIFKKFVDESLDYLIFLGDYIDRAPYDVGYSLHNINFLINIKAKYPNKIFLLKGNHESNYAIPCYPYEFEEEVNKFFPDLYKKYIKVFREMPLAAMLNNVFASHGGILINGRIEEINKNDFTAIEYLTWSDPSITNLYRGAGYPFDEKDLENFLERIGAKAFIRGHDYNLNGIIVYKKCLTIFSSRMYKDRGNKGILIAKIHGNINSIDDVELEELTKNKWKRYKARKL